MFFLATVRDLFPYHFQIRVDSYPADPGDMRYLSCSEVFTEKINDLATLALRKVRSFKHSIFHRFG